MDGLHFITMENYSPKSVLGAVRSQRRHLSRSHQTSPGRGEVRRVLNKEGLHVHLPSVTTSCCFVTSTNQPDHREAGKITYPILEHTGIPEMWARETQIRLKLQGRKKIPRTSLLVPGLNSSLEIYSRWEFLFYHKCAKMD